MAYCPSAWLQELVEAVASYIEARIEIPMGFECRPCRSTTFPAVCAQKYRLQPALSENRALFQILMRYCYNGMSRKFPKSA
jgi:hypothetical protein